MSKSETFILVNQTKRVYFNAESPTSTDAVVWNQPCNMPLWGSAHSKVKFDIRITGVTGAPTSWSLGVKFQTLLIHTTGMQFEYPKWIDLDTQTVLSNAIEGPWSSTKRSGDTGAAPVDGGFGVIATEANIGSLPIFKTRTITHFGQACRIKLDPFAVGGTTPYLNLTILATLFD